MEWRNGTVQQENKQASSDSRVMKWARACLGVGLIVILGALVVGKLTTGGLGAQILGIAGVALMGGAGLAVLLVTVIKKVRGADSVTDSE
jgi:hypothetical protein